MTGLHYAFGEPGFVERNSRKAIEWLTKSAEQGHRDAQYHLGSILLRGFPDASKKENQRAMNPREGAKWLEKAADQGCATSAFRLGCCYTTGDDVAVNLSKALKFNLMAAEHSGKHQAEASFNVAYACEHGEGTCVDLSRAAFFYERAATSGCLQSCNRLGEMLFLGTGVAVDQKKAAGLYQRAALLGDSDGEVNLGKCPLYMRLLVP